MPGAVTKMLSYSLETNVYLMMNRSGHVASIHQTPFHVDLIKLKWIESKENAVAAVKVLIFFSLVNKLHFLLIKLNIIKINTISSYVSNLEATFS